MKFACILVTVVALALSSIACAQDCPPLQPQEPQGAAFLPGALMGVRYGGTGMAPLSLDVYTHADGAVRPLAVVLRGGKGTVGRRASYVGQLMELFGDAGYVVATADYRSDTIDGGVADVRSALRLLTQCHAAALHVDPYKTVLVAEDTAAPVALRVAAELLELRLGRYAGAPAAPAAVVITGGRFTGAVPAVVPTRVVHGAADGEVPVADALAVCARASSPCEVAEVAGASHRVENWWPSQWGYKAALLEWLRPHVGVVPAPSRPAGAGHGLRKRLVYDAEHGLELDAWSPPGDGVGGAIVIVHGGGWEAGDRVTYVTPLMELAAQLGMGWVSIDYRLTPAVTNREQVADVKTALAWIRAHANDLRLDPRRLVLIGESASGQLVTHVAASEPELAGVVSLYGVYDLEAMAGNPSDPRSLARRLFRFTVLDDAAKATLREFSPVRHASRTLPPMLLVAGTADRLLDQQRAYAAALRAAGAHVEPAPQTRAAARGHVTTVEIEGAPHGIEAWDEQAQWRIWQARIGDWLRFLLAKPPG